MSKVNTTQLRVNNLVKRGNEICMAAAITENELLMVRLQKEEEPETEDKEAPATRPIKWNEDDMLERLGFEHSVGFVKQIDEMNRLRLMAANGLLYPAIEQWPVGSSLLQIVELRPIKYVHELQNLWYTITGHELELTEIKETATP